MWPCRLCAWRCMGGGESVCGREWKAEGEAFGGERKE